MHDLICLSSRLDDVQVLSVVAALCVVLVLPRQTKLHKLVSMIQSPSCQGRAFLNFPSALQQSSAVYEPPGIDSEVAAGCSCLYSVGMSTNSSHDAVPRKCNAEHRRRERPSADASARNPYFTFMIIYTFMISCPLPPGGSPVFHTCFALTTAVLLSPQTKCR